MKQSISVRYALGLGLVVALSGCATKPPRPEVESLVEPRPLGKELPAYRPLGEGTNTPAPPPAVEEPAGALNLRQALALALANNPELAAFSWEVRAADARALHASLWPNPSLDTEVENFAGTGETAGFKKTETTVGFSQLIYTAGKLKQRIRVARLGADLARWDYETARVDVFTRVAQALIEVRAAQEQLATARQTLKLAQEVFDAISKQVDAGAVSPIETARARVELSTSQIDLERAQRALAAARQALSATWGSNTPKFTTVEADLEHVAAPPPFEGLDDTVAQNPVLARWVAEMEERRAQLTLAKAEVYPDVNAGVSVRRFNETDGTAAVMAFSVPLPLFNRNQGRIREARANIGKGEQLKRAAEVSVRAALRQAYEQLQAAYQEVTTLAQVTLPAAQSAFEGTRQGYQEGKFDYLNVLDAQRTLFTSRFRYLGALAAYHRTRADVERLIAQPLPEVKSRNP